MSETEIIQKVWKICYDILGPDYSIFLFGSRASKENSPYSDFDFFIKGKQGVPAATWQKFYDAVQEIQTLHKIDLVDYIHSSEDFKRVASKNAKEIVNGQIRFKSRTNST